MNDTQTAEELRQLRSALRKYQRELAEVTRQKEEVEKRLRVANRSLNGAWEQIDMIRRSTSWQATSPLRAAITVARKIVR